MSNQIIEFPIHFDIQEHYLLANDFIEFTKDIQIILNDINKNLFNGNLIFSVYVLPPEDGSFLKKIGIIGTIALTGVWAGLESDIGKAFIKGLTGNEPSYYAEKFGENIKEYVVLKETTKGFLEKDSKDIIKLGINEDLYYDSLNAKNDFYNVCINNKKISAIGFSENEGFPINKDSFNNKIHILKQKFEEDIPSEFKLHEVIIISSVNTKTSKSQWHTRDRNTNEIINFYMKDEDFIDKFLKGNYPLKKSKKDDVMILLVEYKKKSIEGEIKVYEKNGIKIYSFNDIEIYPIPDTLSIVNIDKSKNNLSPTQLSIDNLI